MEIKQNFLLNFYMKNKVSPVKQDISNINNHIKRRKNLYNSLGIPINFLKKFSVLEVGPGSGHNALALLKNGVKLDLVEPNETGANEIIDLFNKNNIPKDQYNLYVNKIENLNVKKKYDIILSEGFLPGVFLENRKLIIEKLTNLLNNNGIIVITCMDNICYFFENIRRIFAYEIALKDKNLSLKEKIKIISCAFYNHFNTIKYASRSLEDWVVDQLICPTFYGDMFGVDQAIEEFGDNFIPYNSSPNFYQPIHWYKNIDIDIKKDFINQFNKTRHILMHYYINDVKKRKEEDNLLLELYAEKIRSYFNKSTLNNNFELIKIKSYLEQIIINCNDLNDYILNSIKEVIYLIEKEKKLLIKDINNMKNFKFAFGRSMQYLSLLKIN